MSPFTKFKDFRVKKSGLQLTWNLSVDSLNLQSLFYCCMYQNYQNDVENIPILLEFMKVKLAEIHPDTFVSK